MDKDELAACKKALSDIISVCESHKGLADEYANKPDDEAAEGEAPPMEAEPVAEIAIEDLGSPDEESSDELPPPISVIDRPGAKHLNVKRGRGRPPKAKY